MKEKVLEIINNIRAAKDMAPVAELHIEDNLKNIFLFTRHRICFHIL